MRAVVGCAVLWFLVAAAAARNDPVRVFREPSCEEQCHADSKRDDAACDERPLAEADRGFCHEAVRARLDVCLRLCED